MMQFPGVYLIILVFLIGWFSWKSFKKHEYKIAVALLILIGLLLRIYTASDLFLHPWDERYHALVAKNMLNHPFVPTLYEHPVLDYDYTSWISNHIWLHKQPVPLWGMMLSMKVFGANELAIRIPSILLSTIGIGLMYRIGRKLFNRKVGYYAAFLYAINGLIIEMTSGRIATDHIDIFFLFFVQLAVVFAIDFSQSKKWIFNVLCGITIGLAILSKWMPALIVLPVWGGLMIYSKNFTVKQLFVHGITLASTAFVIAYPWQYYIHTTFAVEALAERTFNLRHITEVLDGQSGPFYYHFVVMRIVYGEIIYVPMIWFTIVTIRKKYNWKYLSLLIWIAIPFLFFSVVATKMQAYTLFTAPAIFIVAGLFFNYLSLNWRKFSYRWIPITLMILLIALPIRFTFERVKPFNVIDRSPEWRNELVQFSKDISGKDSVVVFNVQAPIELMFYSSATVYQVIPEQNIIDLLVEVGYYVYMNDVPNESPRIEGVSYIELARKNQ